MCWAYLASAQIIGLIKRSGVFRMALRPSPRTLITPQAVSLRKTHLDSRVLGFFLKKYVCHMLNTTPWHGVSYGSAMLFQKLSVSFMVLMARLRWT